MPPPAPNWKAGGYLERLPRDPWGNSYQYLNPGIRGEIDVFSFGADGVAGARASTPTSAPGACDARRAVHWVHPDRDPGGDGDHQRAVRRARARRRAGRPAHARTEARRLAALLELRSAKRARTVKASPGRPRRTVMRSCTRARTASGRAFPPIAPTGGARCRQVSRSAQCSSMRSRCGPASASSSRPTAWVRHPGDDRRGGASITLRGGALGRVTLDQVPSSMTKDRGFTLVEVLVALAIVAVASPRRADRSPSPPTARSSTSCGCSPAWWANRMAEFAARRAGRGRPYGGHRAPGGLRVPLARGSFRSPPSVAAPRRDPGEHAG